MLVSRTTSVNNDLCTTDPKMNFNENGNNSTMSRITAAIPKLALATTVTAVAYYAITNVPTAEAGPVCICHLCSWL